MANKTGKELSWRLVYDPKDTWCNIFESDGVTESINTIEEFETEQEAKDRAVKLGLELPVDPTIDRIQDIEDVSFVDISNEELNK
jgi:hypothetical protein